MSGEWQPIETAPAPKAGRFLAVLDGVDRAILMEWNGAVYCTIDGHDWTGRNITHWMPLPSPPETNNVG